MAQVAVALALRQLLRMLHPTGGILLRGQLHGRCAESERVRAESISRVSQFGFSMRCDIHLKACRAFVPAYIHTYMKMHVDDSTPTRDPADFCSRSGKIIAVRCSLVSDVHALLYRQLMLRFAACMGH